MSLMDIQTCPFNTYEGFLSFLNQLDVSVMKLGTERVEKVLAALGHPQDKIKTIHIVGTNGKGSVSAMLSAIFTAAGYKTGLFTSPHLIHIEERIQFQNKPLSQKDFLHAAQAVYPAMVKALPDSAQWLTYFEYLNVMAFYFFEAQHVDIAIIEAGLGGRLDSTNVLAKPEAIVVTPISFDHMDRLGHTLPLIAQEKAGVFKPKVPIFTNQNDAEVCQTLTSVATTKNAPIKFISQNRLVSQGLKLDKKQGVRCIFDTLTQKTYVLNLMGHYQLENLALVLDAIENLQPTLPVSEEALTLGLKTVHWPGRFQYIPETQWVIDGSHNPAGFKSLLETLQQDFPNTKIQWGITLLANRDPAMITPLLQYSQTASIDFLSPNEAGRFHAADVFQPFTAHIPFTVPITYGLSPLAFLQRPIDEETLKIVTGSLYTAGAVLKSVSGF